jgi:2-polyprenyl-6-methoxyphenol hydroxylase-like FAD-dependent oxidoreductase
MSGYELGRHRVPSVAQRPSLPYTPEGPCGCAQIYYDPILLDHAGSLPSVTLRHKTRLDSFAQESGRVLARLVDVETDWAETISAQYVVGCDGAGGTVAQALGVRYGGLGVFSHSLNIYFRCPQLASLHDMGWARFYRFTDAGGSWGEVIGIDGKELWRLSVYKIEPGLDPKSVDAHAYMRRLAGKDISYEILSVMAWERRECVADRYRDGRVFIAGDAAHQNSPTGGLGLHTGLADAVDLGWKLVAVVQGWGGDALLSSYEAERRPVAEANVRACTAEFNTMTKLPGGPAIGDDSPEGSRLRRQFAEAFGRTREGRSVGFTDNLRLGYCYEASPIVLPDGTKGPPIETPDFVPNARPGTRAPHAWLGPGRSTLDLFGKGFVLLRFAPQVGSAGALGEAAAARGVPFRIFDIADPAIAALYERPLVLVRPDGHVAWRGDAVPPDAFALIDRVRGANLRPRT